MAQRVLSIQSHVVYGYVGNKAATFPLQVLGFDVDAINTVHFSNHTGYSAFAGKRLAADELLQIGKTLEDNGLLNHSHLLTGYVGNAEVLSAILSILTRLRAVNPHTRYVCDPVLGDNGKLYVPPDLVRIYADEVIPLADVITPNQFEAEQLTGISIRTDADARECVERLLHKGPKVVIITSVTFDTSQDVLHIFVGHRTEAGNTHYRGVFERLDCPFSGTGDLFSALILAGLSRHADNVVEATEAALSSINAILRRTLDCWLTARTMASKELALIQSKTDIETPPAGLIKLQRY